MIFLCRDFYKKLAYAFAFPIFKRNRNFASGKFKPCKQNICPKFLEFFCKKNSAPFVFFGKPQKKRFFKGIRLLLFRQKHIVYHKYIQEGKPPFNKLRGGKIFSARFKFSPKIKDYAYFSMFSTSARVSSRSLETPSSCMVTP